MKRLTAYFIVVAALCFIAGCSKKPAVPENVNITARTENMPEQGDEPLEEMPDDDQGVIHF
ncbi:MAG: hypothetical protein J6X25_03140 [Bacteroidales bacterium]|nr:hypothetical protein [Bacteroidales bacterium]